MLEPLDLRQVRVAVDDRRAALEAGGEPCLPPGPRTGVVDHPDPHVSDIDDALLRQRCLERGLAEWLGARSELRVVAEGTDLTLGVEGRTWIPCDGTENFPDGELVWKAGRFLHDVHATPVPAVERA